MRGTVLASLDRERLRWRGQRDKRATVNSESDRVMEKGGVEKKGTNARGTVRRGGAVWEYMGNL